MADYTHRYPTCWRCKTELVFRLVDEWFISMGEVYDKPRERADRRRKGAQPALPDHGCGRPDPWIPDFGYAREMDWLRNMHDWMISKKRYWGLALPIWVCEDCEHFEVIGDEKELQSARGGRLGGVRGAYPAPPLCGRGEAGLPEVRRRDEPRAGCGQPLAGCRHRPVQHAAATAPIPEYWRKWYPAQWISESFPGQFRNWFYSLLAMATVVDQSPPFLQNFGYATLLAEDGRPMHKSWGNSIEFNEAADKMGVDVMRWLYATQKPENDLLFGYHRGDEARRQFLIPLWNVYSFFVTYANLDGWTPAGPFDPDYPGRPDARTSDNLLDRWVLARLNQLVERVTGQPGRIGHSWMPPMRLACSSTT